MIDYVDLRSAADLAHARGYGPFTRWFWAWRYVTKRKVRWFPASWQRWV